MRRFGTTAGHAYMPPSRVRRQSMALYQRLKMRGLLKSAVAYILVLFIFSLGYVWTRVQVVETGYRLRKLEDQQEKLKEENRSLMVEAATLRSPQRLEHIAKDAKLHRPEETQVIYLKE